MTFDELLRILVQRKGSDLHLVAGLYPAIRVHGELVPLSDKEKLNPQSAKELIYSVLREFVEILKKNKVPVWRLYLFGSYAKDSFDQDSDIDLAVFWDKEDIDGFDEDVFLMGLRRDLDTRIEPHSFARTDFDETDPFIREIIETGKRLV